VELGALDLDADGGARVGVDVLVDVVLAVGRGRRRAVERDEGEGGRGVAVEGVARAAVFDPDLPAELLPVRDVVVAATDHAGIRSRDSLEDGGRIEVTVEALRLG